MEQPVPGVGLGLATLLFDYRIVMTALESFSDVYSIPSMLGSKMCVCV